ncbi:hypothetical protein NXS19_006045 [Fusarium pseudograminearum]|nr:hypothetical protein NXS19_006045 [Fusarium pseudograminearum]
MLSNTGSLVFGLMLGVAQITNAQLSNAAPSDSMVALTSPIYPTATDPAPPVSTDDCLAKCNKARDDCGTAPNANQATCAAEFATCVGYYPYDTEGNFVPPTACSSATTLASTMKPTEPAKSTEPTKPTETMMPTGEETKMPEPTETHVIVSGAGHVSGGQALGLLGAVGVAALAFL